MCTSVHTMAHGSTGFARGFSAAVRPLLAPDRRRRSQDVSKMVLLSELAAHLESGRLRIINTPMGQELIAELNSFVVDFTSAGNMTCARRITTAIW